jgi:hypothetical protein
MMGWGVVSGGWRVFLIFLISFSFSFFLFLDDFYPFLFSFLPCPLSPGFSSQKFFPPKLLFLPPFFLVYPFHFVVVASFLFFFLFFFFF